MSIDEREDSDEEQEAVFASMPFVVNNEVVDSYGGTYSITLNEDQFPIVTPVNLSDTKDVSAVLARPFFA